MDAVVGNSLAIPNLFLQGTPLIPDVIISSVGGSGQSVFCESKQFTILSISKARPKYWPWAGRCFTQGQL
jgi:hypothetical protein